MFDFVLKGASASQLEKDIGSDLFPANEHYFGLVNFGNTCYSNSVLQALYFCKPFRDKVLEYKAKNKRKEKKVGTIAPKKFIARLRKEKVEFDNYMQHDAHEFLNFLINHINEIILAERNQTNTKSSKQSGNGTNAMPNNLNNNVKTRCLNCETVTSKDEDFFDLSIDVEQNTSITNCLRNFIKRLPNILALHLKRFKYMEQYNRFIKVSHRVVFPLELRIFNTSDDAVNPDRMYDLVAVVIHCGSGPNRGHYISIVKSFGFWLIFDDDIVDKIDASAIEDFFGLTADVQKSSETGYILFYQSRDSITSMNAQ
ncbi:USP12_46 [Lepeophtheirus salmonis]|uniref:ubiquitinyl hydrolase 1 n=1 Tax=Lepeophtheirus salmonis TaxID=72036 RepID=A0A7R8H9Y3_LEPSM|nr:USP12_46 [Lepeophtheirus salmonis]CAF2948213.1 USP12_46 [Lepeophtheirus salmonis]